MSTIPPAPTFKPFNLALIQLGQVGADKGANLRHARDMIRRAANGEGAGIVQGKPDLIVLPVSTLSHALRCPRKQPSVVRQECFNSPYGHVYFPSYAENIGFVQGEKYNVEASESVSVKVLSEAAKTERVWLLGGPC
jgi:omega-amidase